MVKKLVVAIVALLVLPMAANATWILDSSGYLTTEVGGGAIGTGNWQPTGTGIPSFTFEWEVYHSDVPVPYPWHYIYTIVTIPPDSLSHWILEVSDSPNVTIRNFSDLEFGTLGDYYPGPGNPGMPWTSLHGIKFDGFSSYPHVSDFYSTQDPMDGSFYAKDGVLNPGNVDTYAYNDYMNGFYVPVPDTNGQPPIPEPGTLLLLGSGLMGLAGYGKLRLRRRKRT